MDSQLTHELFLAVVPAVVLAWLCLVRGRSWNQRHPEAGTGERVPTLER